MNDKHFYSHLIIASVTILLTIIVGSSNPQSDFNFVKNKALINKIDMDSLRNIIIKNKEKEKVHIISAGDGYFLQSKLHYRASVNKINGLINKVLSIKCEREFTKDSKNHKTLGVTAETAQSVIKFLNDKDDNMATILIGNKEENGSAHYVRLEGKNQVYLSKDDMFFDGDNIDYVNTTLLEVDTNNIKKISVRNDKTTYSISKDKDDKLILDPLAETSYPKDSEIKNIFEAIGTLSFKDFSPASDSSTLQFTNQFNIYLKSGLTFYLKLAKSGDDYFVKASSIMPWSNDNFTRQSILEANQDKLNEKENLLKDRDRSAKFDQMHEGWTYKIDSYAAEKLITAYEELVSKRPEKISASHILIAYEGAENSRVKGVTKEQAKKKAEELLAKIQQAPDTFAEEAKSLSDGPSKEKGGDLGEFGFGDMVKEFSEAAFKLKVDEIHPEIVESKFGFHLIKRTK